MLHSSVTNKVELQVELTRYIYTQLKRLNSNGSEIFLGCPTLFNEKDSINLLISGLTKVSDTLANLFPLINKIITVRLFEFSYKNTFQFHFF